MRGNRGTYVPRVRCGSRRRWEQLLDREEHVQPGRDEIRRDDPRWSDAVDGDELIDLATSIRRRGDERADDLRRKRRHRCGGERGPGNPFELGDDVPVIRECIDADDVGLEVPNRRAQALDAGIAERGAYGHEKPFSIDCFVLQSLAESSVSSCESPFVRRTRIPGAGDRRTLKLDLDLLAWVSETSEVVPAGRKVLHHTQEVRGVAPLHER